MWTDEPGVPSLAFVQLLSSPAIDEDAVERFRVIMAREGTGELALIQTQDEAPLRWFREVYPDLDGEQATRLGIACAEHAQLTSFGPLSVPLVSACTVAEVVELLTYLPLITKAVTTQFQPQQDDLTIRLLGNAGDPDLDCLVVTYCGLALIRLIDLLVGEPSEATMHSHWPEPSGLPREAESRSRLEFDAPLLLPAHARKDASGSLPLPRPDHLRTRRHRAPAGARAPSRHPGVRPQSPGVARRRVRGENDPVRRGRVLDVLEHPETPPRRRGDQFPRAAAAVDGRPRQEAASRPLHVGQRGRQRARLQRSHQLLARLQEMDRQLTEPLPR